MTVMEQFEAVCSAGSSSGSAAADDSAGRSEGRTRVAAVLRAVHVEKAAEAGLASKAASGRAREAVMFSIIRVRACSGGWAGQCAAQAAGVLPGWRAHRCSA